MNGEIVTSATLLGAGFILGLKHALDADHVAVVTTMVSQSKSLKKSSLLGAMWGLGHTATLLLVGVAILLFKLTIPSRLAFGLEFVVGLVVIGFGVDLLRKISKNQIHVHQHEHGGSVHSHLHAHLNVPFVSTYSAGKPTHNHNHRALAVGALHGLAGSAALTLLVLTTAQSTLQGIIFILIFGLGSIISMLLISSAIGLPFLLTKRFTKVNAAIQAAAGAMSIAIGLMMVYTIGINSGFFS